MSISVCLFFAFQIIFTFQSSTPASAGCDHSGFREIITLFSLILYKYSGANLPGNTCLLAVRTHTLPHWPVRLFLINIFPVNALYKVHLDPSHSECRISSDMQSLCRIQPWDKRRQLPLVFHLSRHPTEIHFSIYTI